MFISWLVGYSFHPVRVLAGANKPAFYIGIHQYEQRESAKAFARLVNTPVLIGCVGAVDG
ncbi:hypothetical protein PHMEG_00020726 [Phytophthora megakarya]|uniref:Uncharacterized protein n=1 Tax=Phytophthora megakarya TaxID=4795 RepID=A0A225VN54_9STRA|nr:hypothetical protein PHMEG_00020726 [Phytophthora megakarya]